MSNLDVFRRAGGVAAAVAKLNARQINEQQDSFNNKRRVPFLSKETRRSSKRKLSAAPYPSRSSASAASGSTGVTELMNSATVSAPLSWEDDEEPSNVAAKPSLARRSSSRKSSRSSASEANKAEQPRLLKRGSLDRAARTALPPPGEDEEEQQPEEMEEEEDEEDDDDAAAALPRLTKRRSTLERAARTTLPEEKMEEEEAALAAPPPPPRRLTKRSTLERAARTTLPEEEMEEQGGDAEDDDAPAPAPKRVAPSFPPPPADRRKKNASSGTKPASSLEFPMPPPSRAAGVVLVTSLRGTGEAAPRPRASVRRASVTQSPRVPDKRRTSVISLGKKVLGRK